jgi:hypothetical protein
MYQRLAEFLSARGAKYEAVTHPAAVTAQEQAAVMHVPGQAVAKVLILKERDGYVRAPQLRRSATAGRAAGDDARRRRGLGDPDAFGGISPPGRRVRR